MRSVRLHRARLATAAVAVGLVATACTSSQDAAPTPSAPSASTSAPSSPAATAAASERPSGPYEQSPWWPYLSAHYQDDAPQAVSGGPITVTGQQQQGTVNWILPGTRTLDPTIFGTADAPTGTETPGMLLGVPAALRDTADDGTQTTAMPTPFSDNFAGVEGSVDFTLSDATATDAATTEDDISFEATFTGPDGADYRVTVDRPAPHGWFLPTGGGVLTNIIQHGVTGWGTRLMPTEWSDASFYGLGTIERDGEVVAENRLIHGMLTEFARGEGYSLVDDAGVNPGGRQFHLMVPPFDAFGNPDPLPTGFALPNGQDQPFLHIMFPGVTADAQMATFDGQLPDALQQPAPQIALPSAPDEAPFRQSPWWPYLSAHAEDDSPGAVLGGPYTYQATQEQGTVNWILPGKRALDPTVFGTADDPKGTEVPPVVLGAPPALREDAADGGQQTSQPVAFSSNSATVDGSLQLTAIDAQATDGATTTDRIALDAKFTSPDGSEYRVVVRSALPHGWYQPSGGGVISSFIQHGVSGWGTRLMPTEYSEMSFYGPATLFKDGKKVASGLAAHGMLTEFVRGDGYSLVDDAGVNPGGRHFHLMLAPFDAFGRPSPVPTGFTLPNGKDQPFLHIMYPGVTSTAGALSGQ